ncbi:MAG: ABC transporter ATP-binding protein [Firmicutes bacterium]|nr:ABC transporter ATP-binding protein [Bacillota bacterium]
MFKFIKKYLPLAIVAALFMCLEVLMDLLQPALMSKVVDEGVLGVNNNGISDMQIIVRYGLYMIIIAIVGGFCGSSNNIFVNIATQNASNDIRKDTFKKVMNFSFAQMDKFTGGSVITRITNDITQIQNMFAMFVRGLVRTSLLVFGSLFFIYRLNSTIGTVVLFASPLMLICLIVCVKIARPLFTKVQGGIDNINTILQEDISGIRVIKACVKEVYEKIRFSKANDELIKNHFKILILFSFISPIINTIMYGTVVIILYKGNILVKNGAVTPGEIMASLTYITQLLHGILMLIMLFHNISRGFVSWGRIKEILDTQEDIISGDVKLNTEEGISIELKNVSFGYGEGNVLENISFKVNKGESLAIMGETGSGKTTLANLIPRFYDVAEGEVLINGVNVKEYDISSLRRGISVVFQKSELFSRSIRENIAWGNERESLKNIKEAAKIAQADEFINNYEKGYDMEVAERGMSLSGGQKQRLSIARAVLKKAPLLILDDATSALDLTTEALFYKALAEKRQGITKIIIAQRISTVKNADKIMIISNGKIADMGTHEQLLKNSDIYKEIYSSQNDVKEEAV